MSADCPDSVSLLTTTNFTCTAFDSSGAGYVVAVEIAENGYVSWELQA